MNIGEAMHIAMFELDNSEIPMESRMQAVKMVANMETANSITKDSLRKMMRWMFENMETESKKIYAVTQGDYSDYHIVALTANKQRAENIAKLLCAEVEEYEDGAVGEVQAWFEYYEADDGIIPRVLNTPDCKWREGVHEDFNNFYTVDVLAKDADHARRKAQDMIAEYKARERGVSV